MRRAAPPRLRVVSVDLRHIEPFRAAGQQLYEATVQFEVKSEVFDFVAKVPVVFESDIHGNLDHAVEVARAILAEAAGSLHEVATTPVQVSIASNKSRSGG